MKRDRVQSFQIQLKALGLGIACVFFLGGAIYWGSNGLEHFDHALWGYAIGSLSGAFAVGHRFTLWYDRPPTRLYFRRGFQLLLRIGPRYQKRLDKSEQSPGVAFAKAAANKLVAQTPIRKRSSYRWIMHLCLSGGCSLAFAVAFPLVFGWVRFTTPADNAEIYEVIAFGKQLDSFSVHGVKAALIFNALNIAGILVLLGLVMASIRRMSDAGERATQTFYEDILPLLLIAVVTLTGLGLTISYTFMAGQGHGALVWVHMISVIALILYIPFGKLFHMFQRLVSVFVTLYKKVGDGEEPARCSVTGRQYASQRHLDDLKTVLDELGFNYRYDTGEGTQVHYQDISPQGRRRLVALNQGKALGR